MELPTSHFFFLLWQAAHTSFGRGFAIIGLGGCRVAGVQHLDIVFGGGHCQDGMTWPWWGVEGGASLLVQGRSAPKCPEERNGIGPPPSPVSNT